MGVVSNVGVFVECRSRVYFMVLTCFVVFGCLVERRR